MKKIINGLRYNTNTAIKVGHADYLYPSDFRYFDENLYVTKNGRFFLNGEGGAMTKWRDQIDHNSWSGGCGIIALSRAEALEWCEEHLEPEEYEHYFKEDIQDA